ncbi:MAG TPA: hypothetical protein DD426_10825, partial [Clostridiaceae bacterium]|nr:hypothetical protein [Clostridiaceae bacterium]
MKIDSNYHNLSAASSEEAAPAWLTTYSDMMTDLLAIFVILFSFAMVSRPVVKSKAVSTTQATVTESKEQTGNGILPAEDKFNGFVESINSHVADAGLSKQLSVVKEGDNVVLLRVADSALFDSGKADIDSKAEKLLGSISSTLTEYADSIKMVRIEGHTDNRPINN